MSERDRGRDEGYEPPRVEDVPSEDGPAVTAAGITPRDIDDLTEE